jgi:NADH-ubiquinone oxidoreductase chain 3
MYAIVYLILDLEIILIYPYAMSIYENGIYGLVIMILFTLIITVGFAYELGSGALHIDSRQHPASHSHLAACLLPLPTIF